MKTKTKVEEARNIVKNYKNAIKLLEQIVDDNYMYQKFYSVITEEARKGREQTTFFSRHCTTPPIMVENCCYYPKQNEILFFAMEKLQKEGFKVILYNRFSEVSWKESKLTKIVNLLKKTTKTIKRRKYKKGYGEGI